MVTIIAVALATCLAAPTLAVYPGYFGYNVNSVPYPYQHLGPHYPFIVPASTTPLIYSEKASPLFAPPPPPPPPPPRIPVQQPIHIYSPPDVYRGFAYQTNYDDGGVSQVVFVRGPDAKALLEQSIRSFSFNSFPLPLPITKFSNVQKITQNTTTKASGETTAGTPASTTPDINAEEKATLKSADGSTTIAAPPTPHSTVTPFIGPHAPGAFFYSVQVRPPEIDNSLTPSLPYFAQSFYNPNDFFRRISIPALFPASEAKTENNEASTNEPPPVSSDDASPLDRSGFSSDSEDSSSSPGNDISSPTTVPSSSGEDTTSSAPDTESATDSPADNGSSVAEENSGSNEETNAPNTESSASSESSSSDDASSGSSNLDSDSAGESSDSADENTTTSNEPDTNSISTAAEDTHASSDSDSGKETSPTDEPSDSGNESTEVPTTAANE